MSIITAVSVSNLIGVALLLTLFLSNRESFLYDREMRVIGIMSLLTALTCLAEMASYMVDGRSRFGIYALNTWVYFANPVVSYMWLNFLSDHIGYPLSARMRRLNLAILLAGALLLVLNWFFPLVFTVEDGCYQRGDLFFVFSVVGFYFIAEAIVKYCSARKKGGALVYFPVVVFVLPISAAIAIQSAFYGVSVIWVGVALAIAGMVSSLKNELIYIDHLTGIHNRYYLEQIKKSISQKHGYEMTGMMLDLNDFKSINDTFGHAVGDEALIAASDIFVKATGRQGKVIRYAGDEFVIILNSLEDDVIEAVIRRIREGMEDFNRTARYRLSASVGYHKFRLDAQSFDDFMNIIDTKMYENKVEYYKNHEKNTPATR